MDIRDLWYIASENVKFLKFHAPSSILSEIENVGYLRKPLETK